MTEPQPELDHPKLNTLTAREAVDRLRRDGRLVRVLVEDLKLEGEFPAGVRFEHCRLVRPRFNGTVFKEAVDFQDCTLLRAIFRDGCVFEKGVRFSASTLRKAEFASTKFLGTARFDNAILEGIAKFIDCEFPVGCRFWEARLNAWMDFKRCKFGDIADFRSFHADQGLQFSECVFEGDALFRGSFVAKKLEFQGTRFDKLLDFSKAKLHDFVYLEQIEQGPNQTFAFNNVISDRMLLKTSQLRGRLASENAEDHANAAHEYALLKRNFQTLHRYEDEDWAFYRFKVNQRRAKPTSWLRPWTKLLRLCDKLLLDWGCGYGTNPVRAVLTALLIVVAFGVTYGIESDLFDQVGIPFGFLPAESWVNRITYGLMRSISVFTAGFGGDHLRSAHGWILIPLAGEALMGTLLWGLFIVAFSRKVIR